MVSGHGLYGSCHGRLPSRYSDITLGLALNGAGPQNAQNGASRRRRRPQKGSVCEAKLLTQRAGFLNELPRDASIGVPRLSPFKKGSLRAASEVPSSFLRPSAAPRASGRSARSAVPVVKIVPNTT